VGLERIVHHILLAMKWFVEWPPAWRAERR
jgi:hypothetical protein